MTLFCTLAWFEVNFGFCKIISGYFGGYFTLYWPISATLLQNHPSVETPRTTKKICASVTPISQLNSVRFGRMGASIQLFGRTRATGSTTLITTVFVWNRASKPPITVAASTVWFFLKCQVLGEIHVFGSKKWLFKSFLRQKRSF